MAGSKYKKIIDDFNKNNKNRQDLLKSIDSSDISEIILSNTDNSQKTGFNFYCAALSIDDEEKVFEIIENVLPKLNRDELSLRDLQDFFSRLSLELNKKSLTFVVRTAYLCFNCLSTGDCRAIFYKDILPVCLKVLLRNELKVVTYDSEDKTCKEIRQDIINQIIRKPISISIITNLVSMFKDIELSPSQQNLLITKVCESIPQITQSEIANLALVTFQISSYSQIIMPLLALDKYFSRKRYRFELNEADSSSVDSIEETSREGIVQAEETIIYHFQNYAEFTTLEKDVTNALKNLAYTPNVILSPFLSIILVSIAKISSSVEGNFRLNQSTILPFMKSIFKFNEEHRSILKSSGWARTIDPVESVNTEPLLRILKQNTCNLKQDLALNGLFGLSFLLLKTKSSNELNKFAMEFLNEILRNRPEFTSDIMYIIVKMLFCEKNKGPIIEAFSSFIQNRYLDITASEPALKKLIEDLTELDLYTALSIESVIFTAITKSITLRDLMIEIMKKAMYQRNVAEKRKMAVLSFCIMLRKFTKTRASGNQPRFSHNISMFSLTQSQIAVNSNTNKNVRQAEIIMLEILGLLRRCFSENNEIKVMLYESLFNSISANSDIIPYIVEFLDGHFRMYFECESEESQPDLIINFEKLFKSSKNTDELILMDDLGQLLKFVINCMIMSTEQHEKLNCDIEIYEKIIKTLIERSLNATMDHLHVFSVLNSKNIIIISQFLNCLEALMVYCYHKIKQDDENVSKIIMLFSKHQKTATKAKKLLEHSKKGQKSDKNSSAIGSKKNDKLELSLNCIWSLRECSFFLKAIFTDNSIEKMNEMKQDKEFCKFVLDSTACQLKSIETSSDYTKLKYSRSIFESFLYTSMIVYQQFDLDIFKVLHDNYSADCASALTEVFKYVIYSMETTYSGNREKWIRFLKLLTKSRTDDIDQMALDVIEKIQKLIEWGFEMNKQQEFASTANGSTLLNNLFLTLEVLYTKVESERASRECFNWILSFCKKTSIKNKSISTNVIKLLMSSISQHENSLLIDCVAHKIATCFKYRRAMSEPENYAQNNLSIIGKQTTIEEAFHEFIEFLKSQMHFIEIYIKRANSFNAYIRLDGQESRNETCNYLQQLETAMCTKLVSLGKALERIASSNFPVMTRYIEKIVGVINVYYKCLENLMKHFRKHYDIRCINYQSIGIEELIKYSKKFAVCIYGIAPYIEATADAEYNDSKEKKEVKTKKRDLILNKATKIIPRMIFLIETFNKSVNTFDAAAKTNFKKLLHSGEIRDFHIRNSVLFDAVESSQATARDSQELDDEDESTNTSERQQPESDDENIEPAKRKANKRKTLISDSSDSDTSEDENDDDTENESLHEIEKNVPLTRERFERNVKIMAKKTTKGRKAKSTRGRKK